MSRYKDIRFRGVVKQEFRENFAPIALEGKWIESTDEKLRDFGKTYPLESMKIPNADSKGNYAIEQWNEKPLEKSWDMESGAWQFQISININKSYCLYDFEEDILPYLMETVEYETWLEPAGKESISETTVHMQLIDGKLR